MKVYPFIAAEKAAAGNVARACSVLSVSRSAYYDWAGGSKSARAQEDERLSGLVERVHRETGAPTVRRASTRNSARTEPGRAASGLPG